MRTVIYIIETDFNVINILRSGIIFIKVQQVCVKIIALSSRVVSRVGFSQ